MGQMQAEIQGARKRFAEPKPLGIAVSPNRQLTPAEIAYKHLQSLIAFDEEIRNTGSPLASGGPDENYVQQLRDIAAGRIPNPLPGPIRVAFNKSRPNVAPKDEIATLRALARAELVAIDIDMHIDEGHIPPPISG
jgi:hypothetical protein